MGFFSETFQPIHTVFSTTYWPTSYNPNKLAYGSLKTDAQKNNLKKIKFWSHSMVANPPLNYNVKQELVRKLVFILKKLHSAVMHCHSTPARSTMEQWLFWGFGNLGKGCWSQKKGYIKHKGQTIPNKVRKVKGCVISFFPLSTPHY